MRRQRPDEAPQPVDRALSAQLAEDTSTLEPLLFRVLRLLAALGVPDEAESGFGLTKIRERLRSDVPIGMRSWALLGDALGVRPFAHIVETLKSGRSGAEIEVGTRLFSRLSGQAESLAIFNAAMSERTVAFSQSVADTYDFGPEFSLSARGSSSIGHRAG